jgi:hypothetical protein
VIILNGVNGTTPYSVLGPIQPCGAASSPWKEVLLCLSNGSILGSFSETASGQNTRFAFLPAGTYQDTDESGCNFSVAVGPDSSSVLSWTAGSNQYSTWQANSIICQSH